MLNFEKKNKEQENAESTFDTDDESSEDEFLFIDDESSSEEEDNDDESYDDSSSYTSSSCCSLEENETGLIQNKGTSSDLSQLMTFLAVNGRMNSTTQLLDKIQHASKEIASTPIPKSTSMPSLAMLSGANTSSLKAGISLNAETPKTSLFNLIKDQGFDNIIPTPANSLENFFFTPTAKHLQAYTHELKIVVRNQDIASLRSLKKSGKQLFDCSNQFGEGVIHMACRQGLQDSVQFLLNEANVTIRRICDFGRTPLHDAFWNGKPQYEIVKMLLKRDPDLLYISDTKGFLAVDYIPKAQYFGWCEFLKENKELITPIELYYPKNAETK